MNHQCHVVTDSLRAEVRMSPVVASLHKAHLARLQRFKTAAIGGKAILAAKVNDEQVALLDTWQERQKKLPTPKAPWFEILSVKDVPPLHPSVADIQNACCMYFNVPKIDLLSHRRAAEIAHPRQIAMYLARTLTPKGYPEIGRRFSNRDHTTIIHAARKIANMIRVDWTVAYDVARLEAML